MTTRHQAYVTSLELAIKTMDAIFMRLNSAEAVQPLIPPKDLWALPPAFRTVAERAELANYDVAADQWSARLSLMAAWEALHAARRLAELRMSANNAPVQDWIQAAATAREAARLAKCAAVAMAEGAGYAALAARQAEASRKVAAFA
ncbi:conserved hypothetical protein [Burkholderiales bacterium 8X]|nr:conserved hypothetical protein [Burkholderiales bacterium 8X]